MANNYLSPGVFLNEVDYSNYVSDASTCIVGMVGAARRGPVGIPTLITTQEQMIDVFGKPTPGEYGVYSALQALTKCNQLYYTRVVRTGTKASAGVLGTDKILFYGKKTGIAYNGIQIEVTKSGVSDKVIVGIVVKDDTGNTLEEYTDMSISPDADNFVETIINTASDYITTDVQYSGTLASKVFVLGATDDTKGEDTGAYARAGVEGTDKLTFRSTDFDSDLNGCTVTISEPDYYGYFNVEIAEPDGTAVETWSSLQEDPNSTRFAETIINQGSHRIICTVNRDEDMKVKEQTLTFSGGDDAIDGISGTDIIGQTTGSGVYAYSNPETISIDVLATPGWTEPSVISAAIAVVENRADCIYVFDTPFGMSAQEVINWSNGTGTYTHSGFDSSYAAVYWPWVKVADPYTKKDIWLPPSGFVAAQMAFNDKAGYPWNAPAGLNRGRITQAIATELSPTQGERDAVYGNRNIINPIVNFISNGIVIWGQKTTQRAPTALDRINVRRLLNYLKRNIGNMTRSFVFEQNIDSTWDRWRTAVEPILTDCKNNGGLYEYKMRAEATASDIENNRMPVQIYIKPTKTAEFIPMTFNIMSYSASFDNL